MQQGLARKECGSSGDQVIDQQDLGGLAAESKFRKDLD
jgi:hypothetical protein